MKTLHPAIPIMQHIVSVIRPFLSGKPASLSNSMPPVCTMGCLLFYKLEANNDISMTSLGVFFIFYFRELPLEKTYTNVFTG